MNDTTPRPQLTTGQQGRLDAAAEVLAAERPSMYELGEMAGRIGALEWQLGEMLALVRELAAARAPAGS